jgi:hypothetical protein
MSSTTENKLLDIKDLRFQQANVGNIFSSSKTQIIWDFILDGQKRKIEIQHSRLTGKRIIFLDGNEILKTHKFTYDFSFTFFIEKHHINVIQVSPESYDLKLDNLLFSHLMNEEKLGKFKGNSSSSDFGNNENSNNFDSVNAKSFSKKDSEGKGSKLGFFGGFGKATVNNNTLNNNNANSKSDNNNVNIKIIKIKNKRKRSQMELWNKKKVLMRICSEIFQIRM